MISPQSVWKGFLIAYSLHCLLILTKKCPKASKRHITLTLDWGEGGSLYTVGNLMVRSHIHIWGLAPRLGGLRHSFSGVWDLHVSPVVGRCLALGRCGEACSGVITQNHAFPRLETSSSPCSFSAALHLHAGLGELWQAGKIRRSFLPCFPASSSCTY